jgi:hypothetical protein
MRLAIILAAAAFVAAPAVAQRIVPAPVEPAVKDAPPEGFYKDIPNMYDLLARPQALSSITLINGRRVCPAIPTDLTDKQRKALAPCRTERVVGPLTPPAQRNE